MTAIIFVNFTVINGSVIYKHTKEFDSHECMRYDSDLSDLNKIGSLSSLKKLSLHSEFTSDFDSVSNLHELEKLNLCFVSELYDWSFLTGLDSLEYLSVNRSTFQNDDLIYLRDLHNLKKLNINGCPIAAADNISYCSELEELAISSLDLDVLDMSEFNGLDNLCCLQISHSKIENIEAVSSCNLLNCLYFNSVEIDFKNDELLEGIGEVYLECMENIPPNFISAFTDAEIVSLYNSNVDNDLIKEVIDLPRLKKIYVSNNALSGSEITLLQNKGTEIVFCDKPNNKYEIFAGYIRHK